MGNCCALISCMFYKKWYVFAVYITDYIVGHVWEMKQVFDIVLNANSIITFAYLFRKLFYFVNNWIRACK